MSTSRVPFREILKSLPKPEKPKVEPDAFRRRWFPKVPASHCTEMSMADFERMIGVLGWQKKRTTGSHRTYENSFLPGLSRAMCPSNNSAKANFVQPGELARLSRLYGYAKEDIDVTAKRETRLYLFLEKACNIFPEFGQSLRKEAESLRVKYNIDNNADYRRIKLQQLSNSELPEEEDPIEIEEMVAATVVDTSETVEEPAQLPPPADEYEAETRAEEEIAREEADEPEECHRRRLTDQERRVFQQRLQQATYNRRPVHDTLLDLWYEFDVHWTTARKIAQDFGFKLPDRRGRKLSQEERDLIIPMFEAHLLDDSIFKYTVFRDVIRRACKKCGLTPPYVESVISEHGYDQPRRPRDLTITDVVLAPQDPPLCASSPVMATVVPVTAGIRVVPPVNVAPVKESAMLEIVHTAGKSAALDLGEVVSEKRVTSHRLEIDEKKLRTILKAIGKIIPDDADITIDRGTIEIQWTHTEIIR